MPPHAPHPDHAALADAQPGSGVAAPGLRAISRNGTGPDKLPTGTAERLGIRMLRAGVANARGVAELAFGLMLDAGFTPSDEFAWMPFERLLAAAEMLSLHCPMPPDGRAVLDEAAMLAALERGQVRVYATDMFAVEPPEPAAGLSALDTADSAAIGAAATCQAALGVRPGLPRPGTRHAFILRRADQNA